MKQKPNLLQFFSGRSGLRNCFFLFLTIISVIIYSGCTSPRPPNFVVAPVSPPGDSLASKITLPYYYISVEKAKQWLNYEHNYSKVSFTPYYLDNHMNLSSSYFIVNILDKHTINGFKTIEFENYSDTLKMVTSDMMPIYNTAVDFKPFAISTLEVKPSAIDHLLSSEDSLPPNAILLFKPNLEEDTNTGRSYLYFTISIYPSTHNRITPLTADPSPPAQPGDYKNR